MIPVYSSRTKAARSARRVLPVVVLVLTCVLPGARGASAQGAQSATADSTRQAQVERLFARWNSTDLPGCTIAVAREGVEILSRGYGMADLEHSIAIRPDTIIEAGSVSKQFTAAAVLLLVQQGKVSLDDPVRKYIPELPAYGEGITVRHLLTHTSGLRDWGFVENVAGWPRTTRMYTHDHVLDYVARQRALNYAPGADFSYTNTGYNLAAILVSRVAGKSFAEFSREAIFKPLGMTRTSWRDDFTRIVRDRAIGYTVTGRDVVMNMPFENIHGNGGLLTTVGDLLRWSRNAVHGRVGGKAFVDLQQTRGRLTSGQDIEYALGGIYMTQWKGLPEVSHSGGTAGYRAWLAHYPGPDLSVAVLCNAGDAPAWTLGRQVAEIYLGIPAVDAPTAVPMTASDLEQVQGLYRNRRTSEALAIELADGTLRVAGLGTLTPVAVGTFQVGTTSIRVHVVRDASGNVRGVQSVVGGEANDFERVNRGQPSAADMAAYAGTYTSVEADVSLVVAVDAGRLVIRRRPNTTIPLEPTYVDGFSGSIGHVRFIRDAAGTVTHLSIGNSRVWDLRIPKAR